MKPKTLHPSYTNWIGDTFHPTFFPLHRPEYCEVYYEEMNCLERFIGFMNSYEWLYSLGPLMTGRYGGRRA